MASLRLALVVPDEPQLAQFIGAFTPRSSYASHQNSMEIPLAPALHRGKFFDLAVSFPIQSDTKDHSFTCH
jgi:hypothetical protein